MSKLLLVLYILNLPFVIIYIVKYVQRRRRMNAMIELAKKTIVKDGEIRIL